MNQNSLDNLKLAAIKKQCCQYCTKSVALNNIKKHEVSCKSNPKNLRECPVCGIMHSKKGKTCSYGCSNTFFRSGVNNPNWKDDSYRSSCFNFYGKKCIICGEEKIVAVHHLNENHNDNKKENLIPLCPTHHQYMHSRYKSELLPKIEEFLKNFRC